MKKIRIILFLILILFFFITGKISSQSGWTWLNPLPTGNHIFSTYFIDQSTGFSACASGTILKTVNGGVNWTVINLPYSYDLVGVNFPTINTGYVCSNAGKVFKTMDAGLNWNKQTLNDSLIVGCIAFKDANTGLAGAYNYADGRIFKTIDGGNSWQQILNVTGMVLSMVFINANTVIAGGSGFLIVSNDAGINWHNAGSGSDSTTNNSISFINSNTGFVLGASYPLNKFFKTTDAGLTWSKINTSNGINLTSLCFFDQNTGISAGYGTNIWKTTSGGTTWFKVFNYTDTMRAFNCIGKINSSAAVISGDGGLIYSTVNQGSNFTKISKSFTEETILSSSFINSNTGIVSGNNQAIFKTVDGGATWLQLNCPESQNIFKVKHITADTVIAVSDNGRIYRSVNGGSAWNIIYRDTLAYAWSGAGFYGSKYIIVQGGTCRHAGVVTRNAGLSWDSLYAECDCHGPPKTGCYSNGRMEMVDTNHYLESGSERAPHESGQTFVKSNYATVYITGYPFYSRFSCLDSSNAIVVGGAGGFSHVWRTYDGYRTFIDYDNHNGPALTSVALLTSNVGIAFGGRSLGTGYYPYMNGIFKTLDGGQTWNLTGSPSNNITGIDYKSYMGLSWGTYGTLIRNNNPTIIGINPVSTIIPKAFSLSQNYPNPFNPETKIQFNIPLSGGVAESRGVSVKLIIYDILGREISTLVNEQLKAGVYSVNWNALNYPSGVYFCKLQAGDFSESKKMVLIK